LTLSNPSDIFAKNKERPNILFILSDDHAPHAIGCYGSKINRTPHIDRIAQEGVRFTNCFCTNSICQPSRASILTGKYSHITGVVNNETTLDETKHDTFVNLLHQDGYKTAVVGKWSVNYEPQGLDYWQIFRRRTAYHNPTLCEMGKDIDHKGYATDLITDISLDWLQKQDRNNPFCMLVHYNAPHANWESDRAHMDMYADQDIPEPRTFNDDYKTRTTAIRSHRLQVGEKQWELHYKYRFGEMPELTKEQARHWMYQRYIKDYLRCVASLDDNVGRLLAYLDDHGLRENTIVIYASDQGFFLGDHGLYDKRFMYEPSIRMPLLVRYPGKIKPGTVTGEMALNLDFAPTVLDYAGISTPADIQGQSLVPLILGKVPSDWRESMYYGFYEVGYGIGQHEGVRTNRYKLIHYLYGDNGWELYDLKKDPDEMNNVYLESKYEDVVKTLQKEMARLKKSYYVPD